MRPRLSIDGAITAYRDGQTDETLEASESRRLPLHEEAFDMRYTRPAAAIRRRTTEAAPASRSPRGDAIEIEVQGRWDALALSELLIPFDSFLVQHDHERWVIHARAPGCRGESLSDALASIDDWRSGRHLRTASCRVGGRPYHLRETRVA